MYEILRVLDTVRSKPNALIVRRFWYKGEDSSEVVKPPSQKVT
jgi:hypothetical protein